MTGVMHSVSLTTIGEDSDEDVYQDSRCDEDESEVMGRALEKWVTDASNLFQSDVMARFIGSTIHVAQNVLDCLLWKPVSSCIEIPRNLATNVISTAHDNANGFIQTCFLIPESLIPLAIQHVVNPVANFLRDHTFPILGSHYCYSPPDSPPIHDCCPTNSSDSTNRKALLMTKTSSNSNVTSHQQRRSTVYYIRAYDLNLVASKDDSHNSNRLQSYSLLSPISVSAPLGLNDNKEKGADWIAFSSSGDANTNSLATQALDALCHKALQYVVLDEDTISTSIRPTNSDDSLGIIQWNAEHATKGLLELIRKKPHDERLLSALEKEVLVWTGTLQCKDSINGSNTSSFGSDAPLVRARGVICGMTPLALVKLLLDSNQVKRYNRWSNGRIDDCIYQDLFDCETQKGAFGVGISKIVKSESNLPFIQKKLTLTTLMHARKLMIECGNEGPMFLMVSRSVHVEQNQQQPLYVTNHENDELLIGVNFIQAVPGHPEKAELISVSHMKCSMVPNFLQKKVAIGGIKEFYDRLRSLKCSSK